MKMVHFLLPVMMIYAISVSYSSAEEWEESDMLLKSDEESLEVARRVAPGLVPVVAKMADNELKKAQKKENLKTSQKEEGDWMHAGSIPTDPDDLEEPKGGNEPHKGVGRLIK